VQVRAVSLLHKNQIGPWALTASYLAGSGFGGLVVSVLASGTRVSGFKPGRSRRIFSGIKILSMRSYGREVKLWVPCRRFAAR
jgi:hypothetical protein